MIRANIHLYRGFTNPPIVIEFDETVDGAAFELVHESGNLTATGDELRVSFAVSDEMATLEVGDTGFYVVINPGTSSAEPVMQGLVRMLPVEVLP